MNKILFSALVVSLAMGPIGCSVSATGTTDDKPKTDVKPVDPKEQFQGTWVTGCTQYNSQAHVTSTLKIEGSNIDGKMAIYKDPNCANLFAESRFYGTYTLGAKSPVVEGAYEIDIDTVDQNGIRELRYDIVRVVDGTMMFSDRASKFPSDRPTTLSQRIVYKKQAATPPSPQPSPQPTPPPVPIPQNCIKLDGKYQMNTELFQLTQTGCSHLKWVDLPTYYNPNEVVTEYQADGVEREIAPKNGNKRFSKAYFTETNFNIEVRTVAAQSGSAPASESVAKYVYFFHKRPCNLMNPSGEDYLTVQVYMNGSTQPSKCSFYAKR